MLNNFNVTTKYDEYSVVNNLQRGVNVKDYGAVGDNSTDDFAVLSALITSVGSTKTDLYFPSGTYVIGTNLTIPENIRLIFDNGAMLSPNSTKTITINGEIVAGLYQIFTGNGTIVKGSKIKKVYPEWFGAKGDGSNDDSSALIKSISFGGTIKTRRATYKINSVLGNFNYSLVSWIGDNTTIDCSGISSGTVINIFSSRSYPHVKNTLASLKGVAFIGNQVSGVKCLVYGSNTYTNNNDVLIDQCLFDNFKTNIEFTNNSWRFKMTNSIVSRGGTYDFYVPSGLTNSGEMMSVTNCMFGDGAGTIDINTGEWAFINCSFDNKPMLVSNSAQVKLDNPHFENPAGTISYRYLTVGTGFVHINGGQLIQNDLPNSAIFDRAYFLNNGTNAANHGLLIEGLYIPSKSSTTYSPQTTDTLHTICAGDGLTRASNCRFFSGVASGTNVAPLISKSINRVLNGDAELNNTNNWTITGAGSVVADATSKNSGSYGFHLTGAVVFYQEFSVLPGQYVAMNAFGKMVSGTLNYGLEWYDNAGTKLSSPSNTASTTATDFTLLGRGNGRITPINCSKVRITFSQGAGAESYVDDVVLNII